MCTMSASHLSTCDMAAYMVNCIYQMQTTLAVYEFTDKHIEMLAAQVIIAQSCTKSVSRDIYLVEKAWHCLSQITVQQSN